MHKICYKCGYKSKGKETHCPICGDRLTYHSSSYIDDCECDKKFTTTVITDRETQTDTYPAGEKPVSKMDSTTKAMLAIFVVLLIMFVGAVASRNNSKEKVEAHNNDSFTFADEYVSPDILKNPAIVSAPVDAFGGDLTAIAAISNYYDSIISRNADMYADYAFTYNETPETVQFYVDAVADEYSGYDIKMDITSVEDYDFFVSEIYEIYLEYGYDTNINISNVYYFEAALTLTNTGETDERTSYGVIYKEEGNWKVLYLLEE